jgi:hypothetical protein
MADWSAEQISHYCERWLCEPCADGQERERTLAKLAIAEAALRKITDKHSLRDRAASQAAREALKKMDDMP